jgi:hypothetical protein
VVTAQEMKQEVEVAPVVEAAGATGAAPAAGATGAAPAGGAAAPAAAKKDEKK